MSRASRVNRLLRHLSVATTPTNASLFLAQAHMDASNARTAVGEESMAVFVNKMIKDLKTAHKTREEQLSQAAQSYKDRLDRTVKRHEEMLCAYRDLRAQVEALGMDDLDLGPDEHELVLSEPALQSSQQREIVRLQTELHSLRMQLKVVSVP